MLVGVVSALSMQRPVVVRQRPDAGGRPHLELHLELPGQRARTLLRPADEALERCTGLVTVPTTGAGESLNVAVAGSVLLYAVADR